jgi:hypothetical protein
LRPQPAKVKKGVKSTKVKLGTRVALVASTIYTWLVRVRNVPLTKTAHKLKASKPLVVALRRAVLSFKKKLSKPVTFGDILLILMVLAFFLWLFWPHRVIAEDSPHPPKIVDMKPIQAVEHTEQAQASYIPVKAPEPVQKPVAAPVVVSNADCNSYGAAAAQLIARESGCNPNAVNRSSGACGIAQELPCGKSGCGLGNGACQLAWMNSYVLGRYGSWENALAHSLKYSWY